MSYRDVARNGVRSPRAAALSIFTGLLNLDRDRMHHQRADFIASYIGCRLPHPFFYLIQRQLSLRVSAVVPMLPFHRIVVAPLKYRNVREMAASTFSEGAPAK